MNISAFFIRRPVGTTLIALAIFLLGLIAWPLLPVAPLPQIDFPTIQVRANLPGASPIIMAANVAQPLERQFAQIPGLTQMTSANVQGSTNITLQFDLNRDIDAAALDVQIAITAASSKLPNTLSSPPSLRKVNPADSPILILSMQSEVLPITQVSDYADSVVAQRLSQISGVGLVSVFGAQKPSVRIQVDPGKLATVGLDLEDLRGVIAKLTVNQPKGTIDGEQQSYSVNTNDQIDNAQDWNNMILAYRNGAAIRVRDVGVAIDAPENVRDADWTYRGKGTSAQGDVIDGRSISLAIYKQPGANVIDIVDNVKKVLPALRASIPNSVRINTLVDRTQTIKASVHEVEFTLLLTVVLVVLVIFIFLRNLTATIIPSLTLPLAIVGAAAVMYGLSYSLDNLSLMALTIATGFVIDDAIVMLENIYRHLEEGLSPMQAAIKGAEEVGFTIIAISLSLVAVFIPLLLMSGIVGRLFREFAVTVTITIGISVLISLTLIPMLCARFLKEQHNVRHGWLYQQCERGFDGMTDLYRRGLDWVLRHQFLTLMSFFATIALTGYLFVIIPKGFFPQQDTGVIFGSAEAAQDTSFASMSQHMLKIAEIIRQDPDVSGVRFGIGSTFNTGSTIIALKPYAEGRKTNATQIINRLRPKLAQLQGVKLFMQPIQDINVGGRFARTQYQYTLTDADLDELNEWSGKLLKRFQSMPELTDVVADIQNSAPTVDVHINRDRAASFGITPALIDATIYNAIGQRQVAGYSTQVNSYNVILEITPALQKDPEVFSKLYIKSPLTGALVPLSTLITVDTQKTTYLSVNHQGQFPAITISFNLAANVALGEAVQAIKKVEQEINMPEAVVGDFQGTAKAFRESLSTQPYLILAALIAVYIVLGLLYESFIHPLTILSTLPSAGVGALLILLAAGLPLDVIAIIGIILLIGIVKKNGIMMVDFAIAAEREHHLSAQEAIYQACLKRFRPIMMTTMCALLAGLPLMLGQGPGSELRQPLGYAMVGGLILSQMLTLFTTPVVYIYLDRFHSWYQKRKS